MKTYTDYHIHSKYSKNGHGKNTIEELVIKARELGLEEIAISDHGPKHLMYGIKRSNIKKVRKEIDILNSKYDDIKILFGVEANILGLDGTTEIDDEIIENCDIILAGYHHGAVYKNIKDAFYFLILNFLAKFSKKLKNKMIDINTKAVVNALYKYNINVLTHPGDKIYVDIERIAKAAEETNTLLEINNSHGHLDVNEIIIASKYNVGFIIGSDAHSVDKVGNCSNSIKRARLAELDLDRIVNIRELHIKE